MDLLRAALRVGAIRQRPRVPAPAAPLRRWAGGPVRRSRAGRSLPGGTAHVGRLVRLRHRRLRLVVQSERGLAQSRPHAQTGASVADGRVRRCQLGGTAGGRHAHAVPLRRRGVPGRGRSVAPHARRRRRCRSRPFGAQHPRHRLQAGRRDPRHRRCPGVRPRLTPATRLHRLLHVPGPARGGARPTRRQSLAADVTRMLVG